MNKYDAGAITTYEGLAAIRNTPTFCIDDLEIAGQLRLIIELLDNAIDETQLKENGFIRVIMYRDLKTKKYQIAVTDNGRGIPIGHKKGDTSTFLNIVTKLHTSGKFGGGSAYDSSGGMFGVGFKVTIGLSEYCRVITTREDAMASICVVEGVHKDVDYIPFSKKQKDTSTTIVYTPDSSIMVDTKLFTEIGPGEILERLCKQAYFSKYNIEFYVIDSLLPEKHVKFSNPQELLNTLDESTKNTKPYWCRENYDRLKWIRQYWNVKKDFDWSAQFASVRGNQSLAPLYYYEIDLFYLSAAKTGNRFGIVNNLPVLAPDSDNIKVPLQCLKDALSPNITDTSIRKFFMEQYRFPIFIAIEVQYGGAKFSSAIKTSLKDKQFRDLFYKELKNVFTHTDVGKEKVLELYAIMEDDIKSSYMESIGEKVINTTRGRLFEKLKRPENYVDCDNKNSSENELFLTEGSSASGIKTVKNKNHAVYALRGKALNLVHKPGQSRGELLKEALSTIIYFDVFTILNYDPRSTENNNLNFGKVFIMVDGDDHGKHIAAIIAGAFQLIAPDLIEKRILHVVAPPYYKLSFGSKKTKKNIYIRDQSHLVQWYCKYLYYPNVAINIVDSNNHLPTKLLNLDEYTAYVTYVMEIGSIINNVSSSLVIDPYVLETLCYCIHELEKGPSLNVDVIKKVCQADNVIYDQKRNSLKIVLGNVDHIITLIGVVEKLYETLIPKLKNIHWDKWYPVITTLKTDKYIDTPVSNYQLYKLLSSISDSVDNKPLKGIGSMDNKEAFTTCMDPEVRRVFAITNTGSIDKIFDLLGDDSYARKQLVKPPVSII